MSKENTEVEERATGRIEAASFFEKIMAMVLVFAPVVVSAAIVWPTWSKNKVRLLRFNYFHELLYIVIFDS